jgi:hypothetical protein
MRPRSIRLGCALALLLGGVAASSAGTLEVRLLLPVRAQIDLAGRNSITIAPCMVVNDEGQETANEADVQREFERYVSRLVTRRTPLKFIESGPLDYPTYDLDALAGDPDFWAFVGERTQADLVIACSLDFDVQDRSGYQTEEYTSPFDGRTYYRQVLVENTGFEFDIVLQVFDGQSGTMLFSDNFKDFRQIDQGDADPIQGMFSNLYALEDRISGIFAQRRIEARRTIYTD